jgi:hypothetical protein
VLLHANAQQLLDLARTHNAAATTPS